LPTLRAQLLVQVAQIEVGKKLPLAYQEFIARGYHEIRRIPPLLFALIHGFLFDSSLHRHTREIKISSNVKFCDHLHVLEITIFCFPFGDNGSPACFRSVFAFASTRLAKPRMPLSVSVM
jgi:hypothetical protein